MTRLIASFLNSWVNLGFSLFLFVGKQLIEEEKPVFHDVEKQVSGQYGFVFQHEIDHLQGKVFVDHLSQLKQVRIKAKLAKQARVTA